MGMEQIPGGSYTYGRKPCRCASCTADHTARAREYRQRRHPSRVDRLKLEVANLQSQLDQMQAWAHAAPTSARASGSAQ